jgi:hypothetical protein
MMDMKMRGKRQNATASASVLLLSSALMERMKKLTHAAPEKKKTTVFVSCTHRTPFRACIVSWSSNESNMMPWTRDPERN